MTSSLSDPTLNRKKRQKLIKQKYDEISEQLNEIKPLLVASSPLNFYWNSTDEERKDITLTELLTKEARSQEDIEGWKNTLEKSPDFFETKYQEVVSELFVADKACEYGLPKSDDRKEMFYDILQYTLQFFSINSKSKWLKYAIDNKLFSNVTLTRMKISLYTGTDGLKTKEGRILSDICINNNLETLKQLMDEDIQKYCNATSQSPNRIHLSKIEVEKLKEYIEIGEPFYVYRGFLVDEDEYVRAGKKSSGADYWRQLGGKGLSYSLDKNIAIYFAYWNLLHENTGNLKAEEIYENYDPLIDGGFPMTLLSKEDFLGSYTKRISDAREHSTNKNKKPIVCKFLIDPSDIEGYAMRRGEGEVMLKPDNVVVENYTILTSRQLAEGVFGWTKKSFEEVKNVCGMYEKQGIAILGIEADEEEGFILADAESVNALVEEKKLKVKNGIPLSEADIMELTYHFYKNAVQVEEDRGINGNIFTKDLDSILTSKRKPILKKIGKVYGLGSDTDKRYSSFIENEVKDWIEKRSG